MLAFDVTVINGITFTEITAFETARFTPLPLRHEELAPGHCRYRIDLAALPRACGIALMVPDCYAAINVFPAGQSASLERRSFLATGWGLERTAHPAKPRTRRARPAAIVEDEGEVVLPAE